jgi:hypothetical protein
MEKFEVKITPTDVVKAVADIALTTTVSVASFIGQRLFQLGEDNRWAGANQLLETELYQQQDFGFDDMGNYLTNVEG